MARRTLDVVDVTEILVHWHAGRSISEIAQSLGVHRNTIRKYVAPAIKAAPGRPTTSAAGRPRSARDSPRHTTPRARGNPGHQRRARQGAHRSADTQHTIGQLEQFIRPRGETPVQLLAEIRQPIRARTPSHSAAGSTPAASHAILNATATACVFKFSDRNPKIITRWPSHIMATHRTSSIILVEPHSGG
jgi:transposase-like protein